MPQMGVSVSEGTVTRWLRNVGDTVAADEPLLEISTDKVDTEVPSPGSGVLLEILVNEGETVPVGTVVGADRPRQPGGPPSEDPAATAARAGARAARTRGPSPAASDGPSRAPQGPSAAPHRPLRPADNGDGARHGFISPVVARIAAEHGVDPGRSRARDATAA